MKISTVLAVSALLWFDSATAAPDTTVRYAIVYTAQFGQAAVSSRVFQQVPVLTQAWGNASIVGAGLQTHTTGALYENIKAFTDPGLDGLSLSSTFSAIAASAGIRAYRDQQQADIVIVYAEPQLTPGAIECGATLAPPFSFIKGYFSPDLGGAVDVSKSELDYIILITHGCNRSDTLAHEFVHIFGGTHKATPQQGDFPGVLYYQRANAAVENLQASVAATPTEIPFGYASVNRFSSATYPLLGDTTHDNRGAIQLTAKSVAAYRGPIAAPLAPPIPATFTATRVSCSGESTIWIAHWASSSGAQWYELWHNGTIGGPPNTYFLAPTSSPAFFSVNWGQSDVTIRACLQSNGTGFCSAFFTPFRHVYDDCGGGEIN